MGGINSLNGLNTLPVGYRPPAVPAPGARSVAELEAQEPPQAPRAANVLQTLGLTCCSSAADLARYNALA